MTGRNLCPADCGAFFCLGGWGKHVPDGVGATQTQGFMRSLEEMDNVLFCKEFRAGSCCILRAGTGIAL